ncbi:MULTISPECIES: sigma-70 family RNA polymerase sigma factor [unclassified Micromonospora]|uniref:sigma-70 family RNA polymerase sigma factor n=1 Tax=unclassified Micromonospora TaxID=2617518 RepID=UPI003A86F5BD
MDAEDAAELDAWLGEQVSQHHALLWTVLFQRLEETGVAEDLLQETFVRAWLHRADGHQIQHPRAWLYRVARRLAEKRLGKDRRSQQARRTTTLTLVVSNDGDLGAGVLRQDVARLVRRLSVKDRECLLLTSYGVSTADIAAMLRMSPAAVRRSLHRTHRALHKLRDKGAGPAYPEHAGRAWEGLTMNQEPGEDQFRRDKLVQLAVRALLPRQGRIPPPPEIDVTNLIALAHQRRSAQESTRWLWRLRLWRLRLWRVAVPAVVLVVLLIVGVEVVRSYSVPGPAGPGTTDPVLADPEQPLPLTAGAGTAPARHQLAAIARHVHSLDQPAVDQPALDQPVPDQPATADRYTYVHLRAWWRDDPATGQDGGAYDRRLWWAADRSGQETRVDPAEPDRPAEVVEYPPGALGVAVPDPAADRTVLAGQLAEEQPMHEGPQAALRAVVGLYRFHDLSPAQRAAALAVLADAELVTHGPVLDRAGRSGVAVSATGGMDGRPVRDTAVIDTATGRLLSYERVALPADDRAAAGTVTHYLVFLRSGRVGRLGAEPAD